MAITDNASDTLHPALRFERARRAVLVADVVESVRLVEEDEEGVIARWLALSRHIEAELLPAFRGRLVKQLGDALLIEFATVEDSVGAAFAIRDASERENEGRPPERRILLRMGIEVGSVIVENGDVLGRGVNLAQRLMALAGPGEIVVSADVHDQLTPSLDADVEDLGECYLKHVAQPVRAYRIGPPGPHPVVGAGLSLDALLPGLAVIPFTAREVAPEHRILGEVLAEEVIRHLARTPELRVISRLSTTALRGRELSLAEIGGHLKADYVLSGAYRILGDRVLLDVELADVGSGEIVWTERLSETISGIIGGDQELIGRLVLDVSAALMSRELRLARSHALPTLKGYTLMMGAIALMHRLSRRDFDDARKMLETLIERASRQAVPRAWLGKWHVLRVQQGWSPDPQQDAKLALQATRQALDSDPENSLALAIDGFVHTNLLKEFDVARERYDLALATTPNDSLAWLLRGTLHAFRGEGEQAVSDTERALQLSPLDPHRFFYDSLAATACLSAHRFERALELSRRSLRANRTHTSTLRAKMVAEWKLGQRSEARRTLDELLRLEPEFTVEGWLRRTPAASFAIGREWAHTFREIGVPT